MDSTQSSAASIVLAVLVRDETDPGHLQKVERNADFECFQPNEETLAAMAEAARGGLVTVGTVADLTEGDAG